MRPAIVVFALLSTGCAWMFKGSKQEVEFVGIPDGSDVRVDGQYVGSTPTKARLSRNGAQNVQVSKDGFKDQYVSVKRGPDTAWWFWDIATCVVPVTLCIPLLTDAVSGAWMSLDDEVRVKLDPLPAPPPRPVQQPTSPTSPSTFE